MSKYPEMNESQFAWHVFLFNKNRNDFELKGENELKMLEEESKEFFLDAKTTAERLDALVDFEFVFSGTKMKISAQFNPIDPMVALMCQEAIESMKMILMGELNLHADAFEEIHAKARKFVVQCNELKGSELDEDGKVMKPENLPNATVMIAQMLSDVLG